MLSYAHTYTLHRIACLIGQSYHGSGPTHPARKEFAVIDGEEKHDQFHPIPKPHPNEDAEPGWLACSADLGV